MTPTSRETVFPSKTKRIQAKELPFMLCGEPLAIAMIVGADGPSYRPVGATMILDKHDRLWGTLSSGCIDRDVLSHAQQAAMDGRAKLLRYGEGSPFLDLQLPCGGGLDILCLPAPDKATLCRLRERLASRHSFALWVGATGLSFAETDDALLKLWIEPDPRFLVFGQGPEAAVFASLAGASGFETHLVSRDPETLSSVTASGVVKVAVTGSDWPDHLATDARTAATLFFHDHDREIEILAELVRTECFYIGAQGSLRAARHRREKLADRGLATEEIARLRGPIGLIPSTRDAQTLAVSVLAEILAEAIDQR